MIDQDGLLLIERKGAYIQQICPYSAVGIECGDWCPHFGEPLEISSSTTQLKICKTVLAFVKLADYRTEDRYDEEECVS